MKTPVREEKVASRKAFLDFVVFGQFSFQLCVSLLLSENWHIVICRMSFSLSTWNVGSMTDESPFDSISSK